MDNYLTFSDFFKTTTPDENECTDNVCPEVDSCPLTMAYVPMQKYKNVYDNMTALRNGTLFPELDKPFKGYQKLR